MQVTYLGVSLGLCKLDLEVKQLCGRLLNLFSVGILLTDQLSVGLLMHKKKANTASRKPLSQNVDPMLPHPQ